MRSSAILSTLLAVLSGGCGQFVSPSSPAATEGSLRRIVDDVSGGNVGTCTGATCAAIQGDVGVTSNAGTLTQVYPAQSLATGSQNASQPREFDIFASTMTATGRLAERGLALFVLEVSPQSATVWINLNGPNDAILLATGTATPQFTVTSDTSCTSGQRLQTTLSLHLPYLGQTDIVDNHCIR
jgi:hypothetical protein